MPRKRKVKEASPPPDDLVEVGEKNHSMSESDSESPKPKKEKKKIVKKQKLITETVVKKPKANGAEGDAPKTTPSQSEITITDTDKTTKAGEKWNFKISSWNVAGLRAWVKKNGVDYIKKENPDILCLQETKCAEDKLPGEVRLPGYHTYWVDSAKPGYAGVALYSKEKPLKIVKGLNIEEHDTEGRVITAEYEKFYLVGTYVPNAGQGLKTLPKRLKWNTDFLKYLCGLKEKKPVVLCGDLNVAHEKIDLARPDTNTKSAGFTPEERQGMTDLLEKGFVDTFRHLYPEVTGAYTFWAYFNNARAKNTGWRIDYFVISEDLLPNLCDNMIRKDVLGSDHCPLTLYMHI